MSKREETTSVNKLDALTHQGVDYLRTIEETSLFLIAGTLVFNYLETLAKKFGLTVMNNDADKVIAEGLKKNIPHTYLEYAGLWPTVEELFFRGLPLAATALLRRSAKNENQPKNLIGKTGVTVATLFALVHNVTYSEAENKVGFHKNVIPLPQFVIGLVFWYLARKKGFGHAVVAHMTWNASYLLMQQLFDKFDQILHVSPTLDSTTPEQIAEIEGLVEKIQEMEQNNPPENTQ